jgi:hypothetical protein
MACKTLGNECRQYAVYNNYTNGNNWLYDPNNRCCGNDECVGYFMYENKSIENLKNSTLKGDLFIYNNKLYGRGVCVKNNWRSDSCITGLCTLQLKNTGNKYEYDYNGQNTQHCCSNYTCVYNTLFDSNDDLLTNLKSGLYESENLYVNNDLLYIKGTCVPNSYYAVGYDPVESNYTTTQTPTQNITTQDPTQQSDSSNNTAAIVIPIVLAIVTLLIIMGIVLYKKHKKHKTVNEILSNLEDNSNEYNQTELLTGQTEYSPAELVTGPVIAYPITDQSNDNSRIVTIDELARVRNQRLKNVYVNDYHLGDDQLGSDYIREVEL